jgi:hypothetical protein
MELTGKCKVDFDKWFSKIMHNEGNPNQWDYATWTKFDILNYSAKYGVYVDFFDSVDINIEINKSTFIVMYYVYINMQTLPVDAVKTKPLARTAAIQKANEIYNNK